jgi:hypothetical protein
MPTAFSIAATPSSSTPVTISTMPDASGYNGAVHVSGYSAGGVLTPVDPSHPLPVSQSAATYAAPNSSVAVTTSSTSVVSAGAYTRILILQSAPGSTGNIYLNLAGGAAISGTGVCISAGMSLVFGPLFPMPTSAINAIADSGTITLLVQGA